MKNYLTMLLAVLMGLSFASCSDDEPERPKRIEIENGVIYGVRIEYISGKGESFDYNGLSGVSHFFNGFMIDDNGLTEFQCAPPGSCGKGVFGRVTTKDYSYNPLTAELTYEVELFWDGRKRKNSIKFNDKGNGELYTKGRSGVLPLDFPEIIENSGEWVEDPDSYELYTYYPLSAEKAAEWLELFKQF